MSLHIDFETRSMRDLSREGAVKYAKHPSTHALCMAYAFDGGPVELWREGLKFPDRVRQHVANGGTVAAHNAHFELAIWNYALVRQVRHLPPLKFEQLDCTMGRALAMGMPADLATCATALKLPFTKDLAGRAAMLKLSKPARRRDGTLYFHEDDALYETLYAYCRQDVEVERAIDLALPPLSPAEKALWVVDAEINYRGVGIDVATVRNLQAVVDLEMDRLNAELVEATGGEVRTVTQSAALRSWINQRFVADNPGLAGYAAIDSLTKTDVANALARGAEKFSLEVLRVLAIRQEGSKASTAKLEAMLDSACEDNRARGLLAYHGAGPGRWAGRRVQTQNMPRGLDGFEPADADTLFEVARGSGSKKATVYASEFVAAMLQAHENPTVNKAKVLDAISSSLRSLIVAAPGNAFLSADYSNIEGRVLAWLAGEEWKLNAFRDFDAGHGHDLYKIAYGRSFGIDPAAVTKAQRQLGKVQELALGYQGGVGAFRSMAANYGITVLEEGKDPPPGAKEVLTEAEADRIKTAWRQAHPAVVRYWYALEKAAIQAVKAPGAVYAVGATAYKFDGRWLKCRLPSGRVIAYAYPSIIIGSFEREQIRFWGVDGYTRQWSPQSLYGGLLAENVTQATARDILAEAIMRLEAHGLPVVMHVHDEIVCEVPEAQASRFEEFKKIMCVLPAWATGLPIVADGWQGKRYRK